MNEDFLFVVETDAGRMLAAVSRSVLQGLSGRSHVMAQELFQIHRLDLEDVVRLKVRQRGAAPLVRIDAADL